MAFGRAGARGGGGAAWEETQEATTRVAQEMSLPDIMGEQLPAPPAPHHYKM